MYYIPRNDVLVTTGELLERPGRKDEKGTPGVSGPRDSII
jgi:hypothetical protein